MSIHKIDFFISSSQGLNKLKVQAERLIDTERAYQAIVPDGLGRYSNVSYTDSGILYISVVNSTIAAKIKQLAPHLLDGFHKQGIEITAIRIQVQVQKGMQNQPPSALKKPGLDPQALNLLKRLSQNLESGDLKVALSKLISRHTKKLNE